MRVLPGVVIVLAVSVCALGAPGSEKDEDKKENTELFPGVNIEKDSNGSDLLNVKFQPGELKDAARSFQEARAKIKKYTPLIAGLGVKAVAVIGVLFGGLTLLVTKALLVAKLALLAAAALAMNRLLGGNWGLIPTKEPVPTDYAYKVGSWAASSPQWSGPTASASYPYARSATDTNDLAYKAQIPS